MAESVEVQLTRIDGKLDALAEKLDARLDLVIEKMESGDRESVALFKLLEGEQVHIRNSVEDHSKRIINVASEKDRELAEIMAEIKQLRTDLNLRIENLTATRIEPQEQFRTQAKTIIALLTFLLPIITILINRAIGQ